MPYRNAGVRLSKNEMARVRVCRGCKSGDHDHWEPYGIDPERERYRSEDGSGRKHKTALAKASRLWKAA